MKQVKWMSLRARLAVRNYICTAVVIACICNSVFGLTYLTSTTAVESVGEDPTTIVEIASKLTAVSAVGVGETDFKQKLYLPQLFFK